MRVADYGRLASARLYPGVLFGVRQAHEDGAPPPALVRPRCLGLAKLRLPFARLTAPQLAVLAVALFCAARIWTDFGRGLISGGGTVGAMDDLLEVRPGDSPDRGGTLLLTCLAISLLVHANAETIPALRRQTR